MDDGGRGIGVGAEGEEGIEVKGGEGRESKNQREEV